MSKKNNVLEQLSRNLLLAGKGVSSLDFANKMLNLSQGINSESNRIVIKNLEDGKWVVSSITSTNVDLIAYDSSNQKLYVRFKNGSKYVYDGVSSASAQSFKTAPSKGKFVWQFLRGGKIKGSNYSYSKIGTFPKWITESKLIEQNPNRFFKQIK